ncbi:MAG: hypothetical protein WCG27_01990 [Pseudomonadota bacterium]
MKMKWIKNKKGQSAVEYILLLGVVMTMAFAVFQSKTFKKYMGPDSPVWNRMKDYWEYTYRFGSPPAPGRTANAPLTGVEHDLFTNVAKVKPHFFLPATKYP